MMKISTNGKNIIRFRNIPTVGLLGLYRRYNDPGILDILIDRYRNMALKIASEFKSKNVDFKDIAQVAFTGLVVAINRFDLEKNNRFSTFAYYCIKGEILHYLRDSNLIKIPRWIWKLNKICMDFIKKFELENHRYPTKEEISIGMNISVESVDEILRAREASLYNESIDGQEDINDSSSDFNRSLIKSRTYRSFDLVMEDKILLWDAIDKLKGLQKKILLFKFIFGMSQEEIGKKVGLSQKSVSRHLNESIRTLRDNLV